uniref:Importin subunit alpha-2-like n=1 Tax=Nicotiana tabacum TaxID=4097 RepID=A0A1S4AHW9_TOBAC|nr:PREDICTED: importin subunit alpha-2-like [Nicotiana tabacum]
MPLDKLRSATVAVKIRKTKRETPKRPKTSWFKDVWSDDINQQLAGTSRVRNMVDTRMTNHDPGSRLRNLVDIRRSLHVGAVRCHVARFVEFLSNNDSWQLQVEAAWVLTSAFGGSTPAIDNLLEPIFQKLYYNQGIPTKQFRTLLSISMTKSAPDKKLGLCEAMKFSVNLRFAQFIKTPDFPHQLKDDSAWILVLIFSFHLADIFGMVEYGLVEVLVNLLDFPDESLCEKDVLVVGKIVAGDCY